MVPCLLTSTDRLTRRASCQHQLSFLFKHGALETLVITSYTHACWSFFAGDIFYTTHMQNTAHKSDNFTVLTNNNSNSGSSSNFSISNCRIANHCMSLSLRWLTHWSRLCGNREIGRSALSYGPYENRPIPLSKDAVQGYIQHWWPSANWANFQCALIYHFHYYTPPLKWRH